MKFVTALAAILAQPLSITDARKWHPSGTRGLQEISFGGISGFKHQNILRRLRASDGSSDAKQVLSPRPNYQKRKALPLRNIRSLSSTGNGKPCDPSSVDPDVGILSCGSGSLCEPNENSYLGGTCVDAAAHQYSFPQSNMDGKMKQVFTPGTLKNQPHQDMLLPTECDPASAEAADLGVLACGEGKRCVPNAVSSIGGYCESSLSNYNPDNFHRQLTWLLAEKGMCNSSHPNYMLYDCDCSAYDSATGTGTVPCTRENQCLGFKFPGCNDLCLAVTYVFTYDNFTTPGYTLCASTTKGASVPQKFCLYESFDDRTCEMRFNDQICSSCSVYLPPPEYYQLYPLYARYMTALNVNCTNVDGGGYGIAYYLTNLLPIIEECHLPIEIDFQCDLCPGENSGISALEFDTLKKKMIDVDGYGTFSCYDLAKLSYYYSQISQDACPAVVANINSTCCAPICDICGDGGPLDLAAMANFSEYGEVYCYYLEALLADPAKCADAKPHLVDACCGLAGSTPDPTGSPSDEDVKADVNGTDGDPISTTSAPELDNSEVDNSVDADDASRVVLSPWSAFMMICSAGTFLTTLGVIWQETSA